MKKNFTLLAFAALGFAALTFTGCKPEPEPIPEPVKVESVSLDITSRTLEVGQTVTLVATVLPEEAENKSVTWSSSAPAIASVENGLVTALAVGSATITATAADGSGKTATCTIEVDPEPIVGDVSISGDGFDIDEVLEIKYTETTSAEGFPVKVDIASARGIDKLLISISSENELFSTALNMVGLDEEFDLANPDEVLLAKLAAIAGEPFYVTLPSGADVKDKTELSFDITTFIPLIFRTTQMGGVGGDLTADFTLKVIDDTDVQDEKTLQLSLIDDGGKVSVAGDGFNIAEVQTINASTLLAASVKMDVTSARGIYKLLVKIVTENPAFNGALGVAGLNEEFDLANPTPQLAGTLAMLPQMMGITLPYGDDVKDKTAIKFDVTSFLPVIFGMAGECTVDFEVTVVDDLENEDTKTLKLAFVDDIPGEVSITGDGFDIAQKQIILLSKVQETPLKINLAATKGIDKLLVDIESTSGGFTQALDGMGLGGEFDLANPSEAFLNALESPMFGTILKNSLPYGNAVRGKPELEFDLTGFMSLMALFLNQGDFTADFAITVSDPVNGSESKTLKLSFIDNTKNTPGLVNGGFEGWTPYAAWFGNIWCPSTTLTYDNIGMPIAEFWDTANVGISILSANNITMYDETDKPTGSSGSRSVKMQSTIAFGQFAAGNIYTGTFGEITANPLGANVNFGRPFSGRPTALKGWYKAAPGKITHASAASGKAVDDQDEYQIYIMLTNWDEPRVVNTGDLNTLIDFNADYVIGVGQISDTGVDTKLPVTDWTEFDIPIKYKSDALPTHIVIVATSCKYGDYLTGSTASVLQIDDFQLVY